VEVLKETLGQLVQQVLVVRQGRLEHQVHQARHLLLGQVRLARLVLTAGTDLVQQQSVYQAEEETLALMVQPTLLPQAEQVALEEQAVLEEREAQEALRVQVEELFLLLLKQSLVQEK
jgi:hypothetical protein